MRCGLSPALHITQTAAAVAAVAAATAAVAAAVAAHQKQAGRSQKLAVCEDNMHSYHALCLDNYFIPPLLLGSYREQQDVRKQQDRSGHDRKAARSAPAAIAAAAAAIAAAAAAIAAAAAGAAAIAAATAAAGGQHGTRHAYQSSRLS
eukprot:gene8077-biopygen9910